MRNCDLFKKTYASIFLLATILITTIVSAQQNNIKSLQEEVRDNLELFQTNPDKAFSNINNLIEKAISIKDHHSELRLLSRRCWYFYYITDIDNLVYSSQLLKNKSIEYKVRPFEAMAHTYLLYVYANNELYEKAVAEFRKIMILLENENEKNFAIIETKIRAYAYMTTLYGLKNERKKALKYSLLSYKESEKITEEKNRKNIQKDVLLALAGSYLEINIDSTEYYLKRYEKTQSENNVFNSNINRFQFYLLSGKLYHYHCNYKEAILYYDKAKAINILKENRSFHLNQKALFYALQETYKSLSDTTTANHYMNKAKEIELIISQNKHKSMHKILESSLEEVNNEKSYTIFILGLLFISSISAIFIFRLKVKNKLLQKQESKSKKYLEERTVNILNNDREEIYKRLILMVENRDPDFIDEFLNVFPDFSEKLTSINPSIATTEIEFCAFLKLNMPTKEIAKWKNIQPKTVQNRKYRIRKKLNIPDNMDIYYWFSLF